MNLEKTSVGFALHSYGKNHPGSELFVQFHSIAINMLEKCDIKITYIGADEGSYSGKYVKFKGRTHKRILKEEFDKIRSFDFVATPQDSDAPAYDKFANIGISYTGYDKGLLLYLDINETFISLDSESFAGLIRPMVELYDWDFGYGFSDLARKEASVYIIGGGNDQYSEEEEKALDLWHAAKPEERLDRLRDVYPYNIISERQLNHLCPEYGTLRAYIENQNNTTFERLTEAGLHLWRIADNAELLRVQNELAAMSLLIAR
ncbi:MAG: hypothetical protein JEZ07_20390 [Phycisphaerae bacterium]|nr:hypothetical protein [Phycisphaerae bacterium]